MNEFQKIGIGFSEGLAVPLIEIVLAILISSMITVATTIQEVSKTLPGHGNIEPPISIPLMLGMFALMNIAESLAVGFGDSAYAISYCVGAIVGIFLFSSVVLHIYPQATTATIGVIVIVAIGIILKFYIVSKKEQRQRFNEYY